MIHEYAKSQGLDDEEEADFVFLIRKMDRAFLEWNEAQQKGARKPDAGGRNKLGSTKSAS